MVSTSKKLERANSREENETQELRDETKFTLQEGRMTLPGIQTLFGFQLISVFSPVFDQKVGHDDKVLHLIAIGLTVISIALTMTPAAYDRQTEDWRCSHKFVRIASTCITLGMIPLAISMALDLYVIALLITTDKITAISSGIGALILFTILWFLYPKFDLREKPKTTQLV